MAHTKILSTLLYCLLNIQNVIGSFVTQGRRLKLCLGYGKMRNCLNCLNKEDCSDKYKMPAHSEL